MSNSISSISNMQAYAGSCYKADELSYATKQKLEALGIDPTNITSEAQAQAIISQVEATKQQKNANDNNTGQNSSSSEQQLLSQAKELAQKVGVNVSERDTLTEISNKIENKIEKMLASNDKSEVDAGKRYLSELEDITGKTSSIQTTQNNLFNMLNMVSINNKYALGL